MTDGICSNCGEALEETYCLPSPNRKPCPICGDMRRKLYPLSEEKVTVRDGIGIAARHPNQPKSFYESYGGPDMARALGKQVHKERTIDRENDKYREHIQDYETGEVIHHCEEPLSDHKGHGDAKRKKG